jgi:hypothetical protein
MASHININISNNNVFTTIVTNIIALALGTITSIIGLGIFTQHWVVVVGA